MNEHYIIKGETLTDIADTIREKTSTQETITPEEMANGVNEVYEAGKKSEYDMFWDTYQNKGNAQGRHGRMFFGEQWNNQTFNPKYDIKLVDSGAGIGTFYRSEIRNIHEKLLEKGLALVIGVNCKNLTEMFSLCSTKEIPPIETGHCTTFTNCAKCDTRNTLVTIHKINFTSATSLSGAFSKCGALKNITVEGTIPISISFSDSPLTVESIKNIITHLKDYSGTTNAGTYTLTLKDSCKTEMAEQGAIEELGGKTYDQYITDIGWNLA